MYNGNISGTQLRTANDDSSLKSYDYIYDALNRIGSAVDSTGNYNLSGVTYDKNGNLLSLNRLGHRSAAPVLNDTDDSDYGTMDVLDYAYHNGQMSNRLYKVRDDGEDVYGFKDSSGDAQDYWYDANSNMTSDANKGITSITYNHLHLPNQVTFGNGNIQYVYAANGAKLKKIISTGGETEYANGYIYENNNLQFFAHPEGYVTPDGSGGYDYVYNYKDHLGNVRLSYTDANDDGSIDPANEIVEESNYYPFGLTHKGYNGNVSPFGNSVAKKFQYNSQEFDESLGLNVNEMSFRQYDPAIGRFNGMDRFAMLAPSLTPYRFAFNNPIYWSDPSGLYEVDEDGNIVITNEIEIENLLNYLNDNEGASISEISEHIFTSLDFGMDLDEVVVTAGSPSSEFLAINRIEKGVQSGLNSVTNFNGSINV